MESDILLFSSFSVVDVRIFNQDTVRNYSIMKNTSEQKEQGENLIFEIFIK